MTKARLSMWRRAPGCGEAAAFAERRIPCEIAPPTTLGASPRGRPAAEAVICLCRRRPNVDADRVHCSRSGAVYRAALEVGAFITAWQGLLRLSFSRLRQAVIRATFGISELHSRNTSGVQAARCSAVPIAKLGVEKVASVTARTKPLQMRFMASPCLANRAINRCWIGCR
jgi:hypothetical protein